MKIKIALVDDKLIVRRAIKDKLSLSDNIEIIMEASDGEEFLDNLKNTKDDLLPDVVLMDLEMPKMDGIKSITIASILFPNIKFIVLTVFDNTEKLFEAIKAGANGYLLKDDDAININEAILQVVKYNAVPMSPAIARKSLHILRSDVEKITKATSDNILSSREHDILQLLVDGLDYKQIGTKLFISPSTVRTHIANIYEKLHVNSKAQAIKIAYKNRWI